MAPRYLFLTGEPAVTLPLLRSRPDWAPVLSAVTFDFAGSRLHRRRSREDDFRGCIYFADALDKDTERHNLRTLVGSAIPCWPDPARLLAASVRHEVLARCVAAGLVAHPVVQSLPTARPLLPFPYVLKVGDLHRGEGKHLIRSAEDIPSWEGVATAEPFFEGESVRVLLIDEEAFGATVRNESSWIKNASGAVVEPWQPPDALVEHARRVASLFALSVVGVDYILTREGAHLLEVNPFPRAGLSADSAASARRAFALRMDRIERLAWG
ncbi:MAG: hypothetical protein MUF64_04140 [Polyangiaceae bacterium]|jgi:hypothetical protein|nr:hypothetical protein [Polyangiaceae bacterium]